MWRVSAIAAAAVLAGSPAGATSGWGCYRVNVGAEDPLVVRSGPSADARPLARLTDATGSIIALDAPPLRGPERQPELFDVHLAEHDVCLPQSLPLGARWCPITIFDQETVSGWVKRRFLDHRECP